MNDLQRDKTESDSSEALRPAIPRSHRPSGLRVALTGVVLAAMAGSVGGLVSGALSGGHDQGRSNFNLYLSEGQASNRVLPLAEERITEAPIEKPRAETPTLPEGAEARLVMQGKNRSYIVLDSSPNTDWGKGPMRVRGEGFEFHLTQDIASQALSPELGRWMEREVDMYGSHGYVCTAKVANFQLLQTSFEDGEDASSVIREFLQDATQLVAGIELRRGDCGSALWARDASLPAPAIARVRAPKKSLRRLARKRFREASAWKSIQKRFRAEGGEGKWDLLWDSEPSIVSVRGAAEELVMVSANTAHCGEFEGTLTSVYRVERDGSLEQIDSAGVYLDNLQASADFDGDGKLDLIGMSERSTTNLVLQGHTLAESAKSYLLINVCTC